MASEQGFIKLFRKFNNWEWKTDPNMVALFLHLLINANYVDAKWRGVDVKRGQIITGRMKLSKETGISERSIRTCLERLKSTNEITIETTSQFSLITICNYNKYQYKEDVGDQAENHPADQRPTSDRPATDQRPTTIKEEKEINNIKKEKINKKEKKSESENDSPPDGSDLLSTEFQELWKIYSAKRIKTSIGSKARAYEQYRKQRKKFSFDTIRKHLKSYLDECNESGQFTKAAERWFRDAELDEPIQQSGNTGLTQDFSEPDCMLFPPDTPEHKQRYHYAGKPDELYVCIGGEYHRVLNENGQNFYSKNGCKHLIGGEHATRNAS